MRHCRIFIIIEVIHAKGGQLTKVLLAKACLREDIHKTIYDTNAAGALYKLAPL